MSVHAHTTRRSHSHRTRRHRAATAADATVARHHRPPSGRAFAAGSGKTSAQDQVRVKPWQVALGMLALLCSGIDLG
ncbi:MAG: hypothetical protein ACX94A_03260 [Algiphilus sp.]